MSNRISWNRFKGKLPNNAKRVDRGTKYGNPYRLTEYSREESLRLFTLYLDKKIKDEPDFLLPLKGKDLACSCSLSEECHADILLSKIENNE